MRTCCLDLAAPAASPPARRQPNSDGNAALPSAPRRLLPHCPCRCRRRTCTQAVATPDSGTVAGNTRSQTNSVLGEWLKPALAVPLTDWAQALWVWVAQQRQFEAASRHTKPGLQGAAACRTHLAWGSCSCGNSWLPRCCSCHPGRRCGLPPVPPHQEPRQACCAHRRRLPPGASSAPSFDVSSACMPIQPMITAPLLRRPSLLLDPMAHLTLGARAPHPAPSPPPSPARLSRCTPPRCRLMCP